MLKKFQIFNKEYGSKKRRKSRFSTGFSTACGKIKFRIKELLFHFQFVT
jgi:hypothetical protein